MKYDLLCKINCIRDLFLMTLDELAIHYNSVMKDIFNEYAPEKERKIKLDAESPWYNMEIDKLRRRKIERQYKKYRTQELHAARNEVVYKVRNIKYTYINKKIIDAKGNVKKLPIWHYKPSNIGTTKNSTTNTRIIF